MFVSLAQAAVKNKDIAMSVPIFSNAILWEIPKYLDRPERVAVGYMWNLSLTVTEV
jgi:hypothetical protein